MADLATTIQTALSTQTTADERIECRIQGKMVACLGPQDIVNILNSIGPDQTPPPEFTSLIARILSGDVRLTQAATRSLENFAMQMGGIWPQGTSDITSAPAGSLKKSSFTMKAAYPFARFLKDSSCGEGQRFYGYGTGLGINMEGCPDLIPAPRKTDTLDQTTARLDDPFSVLENDDEFSMALDPSTDTTRNLYINTSAEHYVLEMNELAGLEQLIWLSDTAPIEEAWVFVATTDQKFFWHEIGIEESTGGVNEDTDETKKIFRSYGNRLQAAHFYHIHPKQDKNDEVEALRPESDTFLSREDWLSVERDKENFVSKNPGLDVAEFAVAAEGVWWVDPNDTVTSNIASESTRLYACFDAWWDNDKNKKGPVAGLVRSMCSFGSSLSEYTRCAYLACASQTTLQPKFYAGGEIDKIPVIIRIDDRVE